KTRQKVEDFETGEVGINSQFAGQVSDMRPGRQTVQPAVVTEDKGLSAGGPQQIEKQADGGRLASAIQTEKAEDLALKDVQIERIPSGERTVSLREATNRNGGRCWGSGANRIGYEGGFVRAVWASIQRWSC